MPRRLLTLHSKSADLDRLARLIDRYPETLGPAGKAVYLGTLNEYKFEMRNRSEFGPLFKKTGKLRSSWGMEVTHDGIQTTYNNSTLGKLRGSVWSTAFYAPIHEEGGTLTPVNGNLWIYIPTIWNLKSNRTAKKTPKQVIADGGQFMRQGLVDADKKAAMTFVSTSLLVDSAGFPMFCLVKRAKYAARLGVAEREPIYSEKIVARLAEKAIEPLKE